MLRATVPVQHEVDALQVLPLVLELRSVATTERSHDRADRVGVKGLGEREGEAYAVDGDADQDQRRHHRQRDLHVLARDPGWQHVVPGTASAAGRGSADGCHGWVLSQASRMDVWTAANIAGSARFGGLPDRGTLVGSKRLPAGAT